MLLARFLLLLPLFFVTAAALSAHTSFTDSLATPSLSADTVCLGAPTTFQLASTAPAGLLVSGQDTIPWAGQPTLTLTFASAGTHPVSFTVTDTAGCTADTLISVLVNAPATANLTLDTVCLGQPLTLSVSLGGPTGVVGEVSFGNLTYSLEAGSQTVNFPGSTIAGPITILVATTTPAGCQRNFEIESAVLPLPQPTLSLDSVTCLGLPTGFTFGGTQTDDQAYQLIIGPDTVMNFNPQTFSSTSLSVGTYPVFFSITDAGGCSAAAPGTTIVRPLPAIQVQADPACAGTPVGITATSPDDQDGTISLDIINQPTLFTASGTELPFGPVPPGNYPGTATAVDVFGCINTSSFTLQVVANPQLSLTTDPVCDGTTAQFTFGAQLADMATFKLLFNGSSSFIPDPTISFTPATPSPGDYPVTFTALTPLGCTDTATATFTVYPLPQPTFLGLQDTYCANSPASLLTGIPAGGTFSGGSEVTNVPGQPGRAFFSPSTAGQQLPVTYTYTDTNLCTNAEVLVVQSIFDLPDLRVDGLKSTYCFGDDPDTLVANQVGGLFEGDGLIILPGTDPDRAIFQLDSIGTISASYAYTDNNGCRDTIFLNSAVNPLPEVALPADTSVISGQQIILGVDVVQGIVYAWSTGATTPTILVTNPGFYILTVRDTLTGCNRSDTTSVQLGVGLSGPALSLSPPLVFPNPVAADVITLHFGAVVSASGVAISIISATGRIVSPPRIVFPNDRGEATIPIYSLPAGLYYLRFGSGRAVPFLRR